MMRSEAGARQGDTVFKAKVAFVALLACLGSLAAVSGAQASSTTAPPSVAALLAAPTSGAHSGHLGPSTPNGVVTPDVGDGRNNCLTYLNDLQFYLASYLFTASGVIYACTGTATTAVKVAWIAVQRYRNNQWQTVGNSSQWGPTSSWPIYPGTSEACFSGGSMLWRASLVSQITIGGILYQDHLATDGQSYPCT